MNTVDSFDALYIISAIGLMGAITWGLRALPFFAARWLQDHPVVARVQAFLPAAIMALLLAHTVLGAQGAHSGWPWAEAVCVAVVMLLQWRVGHALVSIFVGTGLYVAWVNPSWWM